MPKINPKFVYDERGEKVGALLSISEFEKCIDVLEDYQDYQLIRARSGKKEALVPLDVVMQQILGCSKK